MRVSNHWRAALLGAALTALAGGPVAAATPDAWITTKAKMALLTTSGVSSTSVNVDTTDGQVTLHGTVGTLDEKTRAEDAVKRIDGVKGVRNLLQVVPEAKRERVTASDDELQKRTTDALHNAGLRDVSVKSVNEGVVLLGGSVDSMSEHLRAIEVAARVPGVKRVASEIKSPDKLADREIYSDRPDATGSAGDSSVRDMWTTSAVKLRLMADSRTPGLGINVDTMNGQVTLFGIVDNEAAKRAAEETARKVSGVKAVKNELQVVASTQQKRVEARDDEVRDLVKKSIKEHSDLEGKIDVEVKNGVARLTGTVPTQADRLQAAVVARSTQGVRAVEDDLRVSSR